jgi:uncharacterized protein YjbI with pentapeptide repeats
MIYMTSGTPGSSSRPKTRRLALVASAVLVTLCWPSALAAQAATGANALAHPTGHGDQVGSVAAAPMTTTFTRPDTYRYVVPSGTSKLTIVAVGGPGGSCPSAKSTGGGGAAVTAIVTVSPGQVLSVQVGGPGGDCGLPDGGVGGFGGGGSGGGGFRTWPGGAGGGGASAVELVGPSTTPLLWAGGGGGAGGWPTARGGTAAGIDGVVLSRMNGGNTGGTAGTQTKGGAGTSGAVVGSGFPGSAGKGGNGASGATCVDARRELAGGGGGGGGYFGGGGGGYAGKQNGCATASGPGGGGGGSSYTRTTRLREILISAAISDSPPGVSITDTALPTASAVQCSHELVPPNPGPGEAVFARPAGDNTLPNVVVIPAGSAWTENSSCPGGRDAAKAADEVLSHPTSLKVGAGGALLVEDEFDLQTDNGLVSQFSPWGAVDATGPSPVFFPGRSGWNTTQALMVSPQYLFQVFGSCRSCSLPGIQSVPVQARLPSLIAYQRDLSGANLSGDKLLEAQFDGWNFSGANLTGVNFTFASLVGATFDRTTVTGTVFGAVDVRGATFTSLQYSNRAPSFSVTVGEAGGKCTVFRDTDLVASFFAKYTGDCARSPLLPGSSVSTQLLYFAVTQSPRPVVNLTGTRFVSSATGRALLAGRNLSGLDLNGVQFTGFPVDLSKANLDGDSLRGASFEYANLAGATFHNVDAVGASFRGAVLLGGRGTGAATFSGSDTNLQKADFVDADVSGASFSAADLTGAVFSHALAVGTDFNGVRASGADFDGAHIYGNGQAFANATNLKAVDFANAVLAGNVDQGGGFALTRTDLTGARFTGADCVSCNFTGSKLGQVSFSGAYLPGAVFAGALTLSGANFVNAWLYCGDLTNSKCPAVRNQAGRWLWPLELATGEAYGPVPFATTNLTGVSFDDVAVCPDGKSGSVAPAGCTGHLLPKPAHAPPLPALCSAAGLEACPSVTSTLFNAGPGAGGAALAVAATAPATWATTLSGIGFYAAFADGTIRLVGTGAPRIIAGQAGKRCTDPAAACGDGGPATKALLGTTAGMAVGLDGSIYIADPALHRVRRIAPDGQITTVAGDGTACTTPPVFNGVDSSGCGDGKAATGAQLAGPYGVWVAPDGTLYIADGSRGLRLVSPGTGFIRTLPNTAGYDVRDVVGDATGALYETVRDPDYLVKVVMVGGGETTVTKVVGTGTSGYNGNTTRFGSLAPGTAVQINRPQGLSVGLDGNIIFADTGNSLIRAYEPRSGHVSDVLGGLVSFSGVPLAGFNGDGLYGDQTKLDRPLDVVATAANTYVIADTGNNRVREFGPSPIDDDP